MRAILFACVVSAVGVLTAPQPSQAGDAQRGKVLFSARCAVCHAREPGKHKMGPSLAGVVGRPAGSAEGFSYSSAMQAHGVAGVVWTPEELQAFLADPRGVVPGTGMAFQLKDETDRADVIAYLQTLKP